MKSGAAAGRTSWVTVAFTVSFCLYLFVGIWTDEAHAAVVFGVAFVVTWGVVTWTREAKVTAQPSANGRGAPSSLSGAEDASTAGRSLETPVRKPKRWDNPS
jgi:uncharacterized membrane protein YphA (DoxX/SURF4 family)